MKKTGIAYAEPVKFYLIANHLKSSFFITTR